MTSKSRTAKQAAPIPYAQALHDYTRALYRLMGCRTLVIMTLTPDDRSYLCCAPDTQAPSHVAEFLEAAARDLRRLPSQTPKKRGVVDKRYQVNP